MGPDSVEGSKGHLSMNFLETKDGLWKHTEKLKIFLGRASEFEAIFYVGGHGRESIFLVLFRLWELYTRC